jgi:hypothetical protein
MEAFDTSDLDDDLGPPVANDTRSQPLRYSVLKLMSQSAQHAKHAMLRGGGEQTLARRLGSGTHALLLGGATVQVSSGLTSDNVAAGIKAINAGTEVRVFDGAVRNGAKWKSFLAENDGHVILLQREHEQAQRIAELERSGVVLVSAEQYERANRMADSIRANPVAQRVLFADGTIYEKRIDWTWNGRAWRSTPDAYQFRTLSELKTTRCADPERFHWDALRMAYNVQAAVYRRAIEQTTGVRIRDAYLFAVESVEPYVVTPFRFSERSMDHGDMLARRWHEQFLECESTGVWPGYTSGIEELDVYDAGEESTLEVERAMASDNGERAHVAF